VSNVFFREVKLHGAWQKKAEEHAASGRSFSVRPFNKETHWTFLKDLCARYNLVSSFDARDKKAFFEVKSGSTF